MCIGGVGQILFSMSTEYMVGEVSLINGYVWRLRAHIVYGMVVCGHN